MRVSFFFPITIAIALFSLGKSQDRNWMENFQQYQSFPVSICVPTVRENCAEKSKLDDAAKTEPEKHKSFEVKPKLYNAMKGYQEEESDRSREENQSGFRAEENGRRRFRKVLEGEESPEKPNFEPTEPREYDSQSEDVNSKNDLELVAKGAKSDLISSKLPVESAGFVQGQQFNAPQFQNSDSNNYPTNEKLDVPRAKSFGGNRVQESVQKYQGNKKSEPEFQRQSNGVDNPSFIPRVLRPSASSKPLRYISKKHGKPGDKYPISNKIYPSRIKYRDKLDEKALISPQETINSGQTNNLEMKGPLKIQSLTPESFQPSGKLHTTKPTKRSENFNFSNFIKKLGLGLDRFPEKETTNNDFTEEKFKDPVEEQLTGKLERSNSAKIRSVRLKHFGDAFEAIPIEIKHIPNENELDKTIELNRQQGNDIFDSSFINEIEEGMQAAAPEDESTLFMDDDEMDYFNRAEFQEYAGLSFPDYKVQFLRERMLHAKLSKCKE